MREAALARAGLPAGSRSPLADAESQEWLEALRGSGPAREDATARPHGLLLRAARFAVSRRRLTLAPLPDTELDDVALQAADDALVAVLSKLDDSWGASRFTTWARKFSLLEAAVKLRRGVRRDCECRCSPRGGASPCSRAPRHNPSEMTLDRHDRHDEQDLAPDEEGHRE